MQVGGVGAANTYPMRTPPAEFVIDEPLVRTLLEAQCPDLAHRPLAHFGEGFDNALWQLGDDLLVRLPRRELSAPLAVNEQRWLPELAKVLPLPIPAPFVRGVPGSGYPWHWSVVPLLHGENASRLPPLDRPSMAHALAEFLVALHTPAPPDAPDNQFRAVPLKFRDPHVRSRIAELNDAAVAERLTELWDRGLAAKPFEGPKRWIHGDLHPGNVLVAQGELSGIVDFGDITAGDPATDLASAWMLFVTPLVRELFAAYGTSDGDLISRARSWAVFFGVMLATIEDARDGLQGSGLACLRRLTDEP
jgi:aminoglycoside phosphotransferase (APT) family kinase protein